MKTIIAGLLLLVTMNLYASAEVKVYCRGIEQPKIWQVNDIQEGRDFLRLDCPDCVWKIVVQEVCVAGLDDADCIPGQWLYQ